MLRLGDLNENHVLKITASGKLKKTDYEKILPRLETLLEKHKKIRFFIQLEELTGFEAGALWEDIRFDFRHNNEIGKTAIVGEHKWQDWTTRISNLFFSAEVKFFYPEEKESAWEWVNQ